jgi:hypothetical protein
MKVDVYGGNIIHISIGLIRFEISTIIPEENKLWLFTAILSENHSPLLNRDYRNHMASSGRES